jgi:hypothetical protein
MKSQRSQMIALVLLIVIWAVCWRLFIKIPHNATPAQKALQSKAAPPESLLMIRFRRVRAEMDALYRYRIKPTPFDSHGSPFRIPGMAAGATDIAQSPGIKDLKEPSTESASFVPPPNYAENLLKSAVSSMRIGGVVSMNGIIQFTVNGQLHKEGDVFAAKVQIPSQHANAPAKSVLIRVKHLSTASATLALEDDQAGGAEIRIRLY